MGLTGWLGWTLGLALAAGSAQAGQARFTRLQPGLSQITVQAVLQDHVGFVWFGTEDGLNRYDGYAFAIFRHDTRRPDSLPDNIVSALYEDRQRRLWVGTQRGLALFDRRSETFSPIPGVRERVTAMLEDPDGGLWIATEGQGLFRRDGVSG